MGGIDEMSIGRGSRLPLLITVALMSHWRLGHKTGIAQHRMLDHGGLHRGGGKARGDGESKKSDDESGQMPAQQHGADAADGGQRRPRPPRRLPLGAEIDDDAKTVSDREPRQQAVGGNLGGGPLP